VTRRRAAALALAALGCAAPASPPPAEIGDSAAACMERRGVAPPHPFTTDACSLWPDSTWGHCCVAHDVVYWCGGSSDERAEADDALGACVSEEFGGMGPLMKHGVRGGGVWWLPTPWRWGYGWGYPDH
jgi:hypothetical protein